MILREMPPTWDARFRPRFYARWGRENCIISAHTRRAEYPLFEQRLSVKMAVGGSEDYLVDERRVAVDDDSWLVLNDGRRYASRLHAARPVHSFSIFFRPGMAEEVLQAIAAPTARLLEEPQPRAGAPVVFSEHLRRHDRRVTPVLRYIARQVDRGTDDALWYEEQLAFLMERLLCAHHADLERIEAVPAGRPATRRELYRRVQLGADYIETNFRAQLALATIARAACLSPFHFLRVFRAVHGSTPGQFLQAKRLQVAERLLRESELGIDDITELAGFGSRSTLFRQLRQRRGLSASALRAAQRGPAANA